MKRILFGLMVASIALQGVVSAQSKADQTGPEWTGRRITIHAKDGWLPEIVAAIETAGSFTIQAHDHGKLLEHRVTIDVRDARIDEVLAMVLQTSGLTYKIMDDKTVQLLKP
jgi:hypothetical protein